MIRFRTAVVMLGLISAGWSGFVVAEGELRSRVLALYEEEQNARAECRVSGPHCSAQRALDACGGARQRTDRETICRDAQQKYEICVAFVEDWRSRKADVLAQVDRESPGLGESYTEGVSDLRGLGQQRNSDQLWNDTIKALRNLDIRNCPGFVTGTWMTPLEALAAWDQEDKTGIPVDKDPLDMVLEEPPGEDVAQEAGKKTDEEPGGAADEADDEGDGGADEGSGGEAPGGEPDPVAAVPSDGTAQDVQPAAEAPQPAMTSENLDALVSNCMNFRRAALDASGGTPEHRADADAFHCVKARGDIPPNGGLYNECDFEVEVAWCLYRPYAGTYSTALDCERNRQQVLRLQPYEGRSALVTDAELIYTAVCRRPGASPVEIGPFIAGHGLQTRCQPWPGADDPAASEEFFGGDCSNEQLERISGLSFPPSAPPAPEVWQPPEFSSSESLYESPRESYDDSYDSSDSYEPYDDQGYSEPDTGQIITDAAMQMMQMYIDMQNSQSSGSGAYDSYDSGSADFVCSGTLQEQAECEAARGSQSHGSGGYDDYGAGDYEDEGDDACGCSDGYCTCQ
ncbi:MAG: hypothetical protein EHM68_11265 [Lysobacterales bacterium]|nr:MAG: hypothetical protein EHM68_11265 [Xanthomonadales bacterium]